jgi:hypothetical protein
MVFSNTWSINRTFNNFTHHNANIEKFKNITTNLWTKWIIAFAFHRICNVLILEVHAIDLEIAESDHLKWIFKFGMTKTSYDSYKKDVLGIVEKHHDLGNTSISQDIGGF